MIVEEHEEVTILFSDIVQYTSLAASISTEELIGILNTMFSCFDELCDKHHCDKVPLSTPANT